MIMEVVGVQHKKMTLYIRRETSKLWKRFCQEIITEIKLLAENWKYLLAGLVFQYIHGLAARGVHYLHRPGPILHDVGFLLLPELGQENGYISETLFSCVFLLFVLWSFHPFILKSKKIYTVLLWCRVLSFLVVCQFLRIISFYSTQLPGPNYHCREGSKRATLPPPQSLLQLLLINPRGIVYGCGDLIFSSHMIFTLVFVLTYNKYGTTRWIKQLGWLVAVIQSLLIVASRKHYTVDVVVAWYTVNLVVYFLEHKLGVLVGRKTFEPLNNFSYIIFSGFLSIYSCQYRPISDTCKWTELADRNSGSSSSTLLPISNKDRDMSRTKEENHKLLLNGNSVDPSDWRQRIQIVNGKVAEDGNGDTTMMNGGGA